MKNRLKQIREDKDLSQEQLAIKAGVNKNIIINLERDELANTKTKYAVKLATALNVEIEDLFPLD